MQNKLNPQTTSNIQQIEIGTESSPSSESGDTSKDDRMDSERALEPARDEVERSNKQSYRTLQIKIEIPEILGGTDSPSQKMRKADSSRTLIKRRDRSPCLKPYLQRQNAGSQIGVEQQPGRSPRITPRQQRQTAGSSTNQRDISPRMQKLTIGSAQYEGNTKIGLPHGEGQLRCEGKIYKGNWSNGRLNFKNAQLATNIDSDDEEIPILVNDSRVYIGHVQNNKPAGQGRLIASNGNLYEGIFKAGTIYSGTGKQKESGNVWVQGVFQDGELTQSFKRVESNGQWSLGRFENLEFAKGEPNWYEGSFRYGGFIQGQGNRIYQNCDSYEGYIQNELRHGDGKYTMMLPKNVTLDTKKSNVVEIEQKDQTIILKGQWKNGLVQTSQKTPQSHLKNAFLDERIKNESHIPINTQSILQVLRVSLKDEELVIQVEPANVIHHSLKEKHDQYLKSKFKQPLSQCRGRNQRLLKLVSKDQGIQCQSCKETLQESSVCYYCYDCENSDKCVLCSDCQHKQDLPSILLQKNSNSFYYKQFKLGDQDRRGTYKVVSDDINTERESGDYRISIYRIQDGELKLIQKILVLHPVILDTSLGKADYAKEWFLYQKEIVFMDQNGEKLMWITHNKETMQMHLGQIDLRQMSGQATVTYTEIQQNVKSVLLLSLGIEVDDAGELCKHQQWPLINRDLIVINGLNPRSPLQTASYRSKQLDSKFLSDSYFYRLTTDELIGSYQNIGLLIRIDEINDHIQVFTLQVEEEQTFVLVVDMVWRGEGGNACGKECQAEFATLTLKPSDGFHHNSTKATSGGDTLFQQGMYEAIIYQKDLGSPQILRNECELTDERDIAKICFALIVRYKGCFTFEYRPDQPKLKNTTRLGKEESTSGYFGEGKYLSQIVEVPQMQNSQQLFEFTLVSIPKFQKAAAYMHQYYFIQMPSDVKQEDSKLLLAQIIGVGESRKSESDQAGRDQDLKIKLIYKSSYNQKPISCLMTAHKCESEVRVNQPLEFELHHHLEYPVQALSYPNTSQLTLINLAVNTYQSIIELENCQFVRFVQTDQQRNGWRDIWQGLTTQIYFIALKDGLYQLCKIVFKSWQMQPDFEGFQIINEDLGFDDSLAFQQAVVLQSVKRGRLTPDHLVLKKYSAELLVIRLGKECKQVNQFKTHSRVVIGPFNQLYFTQNNRIMCMSQSQDCNICIDTLFVSNLPILHIQVVYGDHLAFRDDEQELILVFVNCEYELTVLKQVDQKLVPVAKPVSLMHKARVKQIIDAGVSVSQFHFMEKYAIAPSLFDNDQLHHEFHYCSDTARTVRPDLFYIKQRKSHLCYDSRLGYGARWLVQAIQEGDLYYLKTTQSSEQKRLNLFSTKHQRQQFEINGLGQALEYQVMNSCILVSFHEQCLLFCKQTHKMVLEQACGTNIKVKVVQSYSQARQTAFIWDSHMNLYLYQECASQAYQNQPLKSLGKKASVLSEMSGRVDLVLTESGKCFHLSLKKNYFKQEEVQGSLEIQVKKESSPVEGAIDQSYSLNVLRCKIQDEFQFQALQTQNYVVLKFNKHSLYYCKCRIEEWVKPEFKLQFSALPILDWLDKESFQNGICLNYASMNGNPRLVNRTDVIQISTLEHLICFDLDKHQQVDCLLHYRVGSMLEFVDSSFVVSQLSQKGIQNFGKPQTLRETVSSSLNRQTFGKPTHWGQQLGGVLGLSTQFDIQEILYFLDSEVKRDTHIDRYSLLARVNGLQVLMALYDRPGHIAKVSEILMQTEYETFKSENQTDLDDPFVKQLMHSLIKGNTAPIQSIQDLGEEQNTLTQTLRSENKESFTGLISMFSLSLSANKSFVVRDFDDLKLLFRVNSKLVNEFIARTSIKNFMSKFIEQIEWVGKQKLIVFGSPSSTLSARKIGDCIKNEQDRYSAHRFFHANKKRNLDVNIDIMEIEWINDNVDRLYLHLSETDDDKMYYNLMIYAILQRSNYTWEIMPHFVCFLIQLVLVSYHHLYVLQSNYEKGWEAWLTFFTLVVIMIQVTHESIQLSKEKTRYFKSLFNIVQTLTILINLTSISVGLFMDHEHLMSQDGFVYSVVLPSFGASLLLMQLVYWSMLIEATSFYVTLVIQSAKDIIAFMSILMIILLTFTIGVTVINNNYKNSHNYQVDHFDLNQEYHEFISQRFENDFLNALYVQWLLGLGEFEMLSIINGGEDSFQSVKVLMWILFVLATLISQVIMFNTLIAILGDTFSRIMEKRVHHAMKARAEMYADHMYWVKFIKGFNEFTKSKYIYVVRPVDDEDEQEWEGVVTTIRKRIDFLKQFMSKDTSKIQAQFKQVKKQMGKDKSEITKEIGQLENKVLDVKNTMDTKFEGVNSQVEEVNCKMDQILDMLKTQSSNYQR